MKCCACGKRFKPTKEAVYQVTKSLNLVETLTEVGETFDAIDCPQCGCQHVLKVRMLKLMKGDDEA